MQVTGVGWAGVRTEQASAMAHFCEDVLGLQPTERGDDLWAYTTADGSKVEVFGPRYPGKSHMDRGPVVGFVVTNLAAAVQELRASGVELLGEPGPTWQQFRGPDGNVYELTTAAGSAGHVTEE